MNPIEAAANVLAVNDMQRGPANMLAEVSDEIRQAYMDLAKRQLSAVFVALVACEQCGGTGEQWLRGRDVTDPPGDVALATRDCPAVHVEIPNPYGGVVYADPAKCEWRCSVDETVSPIQHCEPETDSPYLGLTHKRCRWVPRPLEVTE